MKRTELSNGVERIEFDGFQSRPLLAYAFPGPGGPDSVANAIVQKAIAVVGLVDAATYAARRDAGLSPAARSTKVYAQREAARIALAESLAKLEAARTNVAHARVKLFAPPALEPSDAVSAALDAEIRQRMQSVGDPAKSAIRKAISDGDAAQDRVLHALVRDPFDTPDSQWAKAVHADRVVAANPAAVASLEIDEASLEWGQTAVARMQNILKETESGVIAALTPEAV